MDTEVVREEKARVGWNWGAFMMPFQFGIGNKAYLCLLTIVPLLNFIWIFVAGFNGAKWAYESGEFNTVAEFNASMRTWNRAGLVTFIITVVVLVLYFAFFATLLSSILGRGY